MFPNFNFGLFSGCLFSVHLFVGKVDVVLCKIEGKVELGSYLLYFLYFKTFQSSNKFLKLVILDYTIYKLKKSSILLALLLKKQFKY